MEYIRDIIYMVSLGMGCFLLFALMGAVKNELTYEAITGICVLFLAISYFFDKAFPPKPPQK